MNKFTIDIVMQLSKQSLLVVIVPVLFATGLIGFFVFVPVDQMTLPTLIGYLSSLSTTVMVLVYIITTSRQLETMSKQLSEMEYSRNLQIQPMPYFKNLKAKFTLPRYYVYPADFKEMTMGTHIDARFDVSNLGNGPAIAVNYSSVLKCGPRGKISNVIEVTSFSPPMNYVPLASEEAQEAIFLCSERGGQKLVEALVNFGRLCLDIIVVYKNALGNSFLETNSCWLEIKSKDFEIVKSSLKMAKTAKIEFSDQLRKFKTMKESGRLNDAFEILKDVNKKILALSKGVEEIDFSVSIAYGSFTVRPISDKEYEKIIEKKLGHERC